MMRGRTGAIREHRLLSATNGRLLGLHSSWDDQTAMRHGIPIVAVREFLKQQNMPSMDRSQDNASEDWSGIAK